MKHRYCFLAVSDRLIGLFVIFPLTIFHWRGSWELQDIYITPSDKETSWWISFGVGANLGLIAVIVQPKITECLRYMTVSSTCFSSVCSNTASSGLSAAATRPWHRLLHITASRLHVYIHGWALMCYWRGLWGLLDYYLTDNWVSSIIVYVVCQLILVGSRSVRTAAGIPLSLQADSNSNLLQPELFFNTPYSSIVGYVLDHLFTQHVIVFSTICVWRGIWNTLDAFVYPESHIMSDVSCLATGLALIVVCFAAERPLSYISASLDRHPLRRLFFEDLLYIVLIWVNLLLWRGASNLCTRFFLPPRQGNEGVVGAWATHVLGTVGLMATKAFNNVGLHGIEQDGIYARGEGIYGIRYLVDVINNKNDVNCKEIEVSDESEAASCTEGDSSAETFSDINRGAALTRHQPTGGEKCPSRQRYHRVPVSIADENGNVNTEKQSDVRLDASISENYPLLTGGSISDTVLTVTEAAFAATHYSLDDETVCQANHDDMLVSNRSAQDSKPDTLELSVT